MYYYSWCRFGSSHIPTITTSCLLRKHNYAGLTDEGWKHRANNTLLKYHRFSITRGTELLSSQHHLQSARQHALPATNADPFLGSPLSCSTTLIPNLHKYKHL